MPTGHRELWFPTSVWFFDIEDSGTLNSAMIDILYQIREQDKTGITDRSTLLGWHSDVNLHLHETFRPLMRIVLSKAIEIAMADHWDLANYELFIINSWGNINGPNGSNMLHNHPNSTLSGVYYLRTPENCGALEFRDPRECNLMQQLPIQKHTSHTFRSVHYKPAEGRILIFPSWLLHQVKPNGSQNDRICISFNLGYRQRLTSSGNERPPKG